MCSSFIDYVGENAGRPCVLVVSTEAIQLDHIRGKVGSSILICKECVV